MTGCKEQAKSSFLFLLLSHHPPEKLYRTIRVSILGRNYYLCARCTGMYLGILMGLLLLPRLEGVSWLHPLAITFLPLFSIIDWTTQARGLRESRNWIRVSTGGLLGIAWAIFFLALIKKQLGLSLYAIVVLAIYFGASAHILRAPVKAYKNLIGKSSGHT